jgi:flagellar hook-associated protein 3 FlgL
MTMRVATFPVREQMVAGAMRTESLMANAELQESSGVTSVDYGGLGQTSRQVINLEITVSRSQSYIDAATSTDNKVQVMSSAMTSMTDLLTDLRSDLTAASGSGGTADPAVLTEQGQQMMQSMVSLLNTQYVGSYLFGGSNTTSPPVDITDPGFTPATTPSTPNTAYYQGDDQIASTRVSDSQVVAYGVTADNPAFEKAMRALNIVANNSPLSSDALKEALTLTTDALTAVASVQAGVGLASGTLQSASAFQTDYQGFAKTLGTDLTGVDVAAVTAQMSNYQAQLTASFSAISTIEGLNLASFLH